MKNNRLATVAFLSVAALGLGGCEDSNDARSAEQPALQKDVELHGHDYEVSQFNPKSAPYMSCTLIAPGRTHKGTALSCAANGEVKSVRGEFDGAASEAIAAAPLSFPLQYHMSTHGSTYEISEIKLEGSDQICIHVSPRTTYSGTAMDCFAQRL